MDCGTRILRLLPLWPLPDRSIVDEAVAFLSEGCFFASHAAYGQGGWLEKVVHSTATHLHGSSANSARWTDALSILEGVRAVPLMTIRKSKGLEYHTAMFVGLDDDAWWSFSNDELEAKAGFFGAFTRAKQQVVFTYCPARGQRTKIASLYDLLEEAGVKTQKIARK